MEYTELSKKFGIGLTGGISTGKSTVSKILRDLGYVVIDADALSRKVVEPGSAGLAEIVDKFGAENLKPDGQLDRKKMAQIIFNDPEKKKILEGIIHPKIHALLAKRLASMGIVEEPNFWFYEASLLYETGSYQKFKEVWCTYCPEKEQLRRLMKRDGCTRVFAKKILSNQMPAKEKADRSDLVINTDSPKEELEPKVKDALERLKNGQSPYASALWSKPPGGK